MIGTLSMTYYHKLNEWSREDFQPLIRQNFVHPKGEIREPKPSANKREKRRRKGKKVLENSGSWRFQDFKG